MDQSFSSLISEAKSILILLASNSDFDQTASALSLYLSVRDRKNTVISASSPILVEFNRLVGINLIRADFGDKNLTVRFKDYKADSIEKVSYDIESGEFRLTVVPKQGALAPKKEQVDLSYSGASADTIILIGGKQKEDFPALSSKDLKPERIVRIHINVQSTGDPAIIDFSRHASSISEVVANYIKEMGVQIDPDIATDLVMGIEEGTQNFTHPLVNADTFLLVSDLLKLGGRMTSTGRIDRANFPAGSIPGEMPAKEDQPAIEEVEIESAPQSWFEKPQIYKGTSVS